jgi:hypothetical protein
VPASRQVPHATEPPDPSPRRLFNDHMPAPFRPYKSTLIGFVDPKFERVLELARTHLQSAGTQEGMLKVCLTLSL